jgi:hypothetical protein
LAHWPRERYLELAPKYWTRTRARLDAVELGAEIGPLTVPAVDGGLFPLKFDSRPAEQPDDRRIG